MTTTDAIDVESTTVTIEPTLMGWARYSVGHDGEFTTRGVCWAADGEPAVIERSREDGPDIPNFHVPGAYVSVNYDSTTARATAAQLLGEAHRLDHGEPLPAHITTTLLPPTTRTATTTTWHFGHGLLLRYTAPFGAALIVETAHWALTAELATRWAQALLTLAAQLDHAHAVATQAVLAERTGTTPTENIRAWLTDLTDELTAEQKTFVERLCGVLSDEESIACGETLFAALDGTHPDLSTSLSDLRLLSRETITHLDAARVIDDLAARYALPLYVWTAASNHITYEIGEARLTEQEWRRVGRTAEMRAFTATVENEQRSNGAAIDVRLALYQAGVLCRGCDARITGEVAETLGRCDACRPADRAEALAAALAAGCPGTDDDSDDDGIASHVMGGRFCVNCGLPLPADYHLVLEVARAEQLRRDAERRDQDKKRRIATLVVQLLERDFPEVAHLRQRQERGQLPGPVFVSVHDVRPEEIEDAMAPYVREATQIIEQHDQTTGGDS